MAIKILGRSQAELALVLAANANSPQSLQELLIGVIQTLVQQYANEKSMQLSCYVQWHLHCFPRNTDQIVNLAVRVLEAQLASIAQHGLVEIQNSPLYPVLHCLHTALRQQNSVQQSVSLLALLDDVVKHCGPVVFNSSPEGFLPQQGDGNSDEPYFPELSQLTLGPSTKTTAVKSESLSFVGNTKLSQIVLASSWRAIREASQIMSLVASAIATKGPLNDEDNARAVSIGNKLFDMLLSARHRGAVEMISVAFEQFCLSAVKSVHAGIQSLPSLFVRQVMQRIELADVSVTRRSAGFPSAVLAALSAELSVKQTRLLQETILKLLSYFDGVDLSATGDADVEQLVHITRIHALNVLRFLLRDSQFSPQFHRHLTRLAVISINTASSSQYPVRNSGALLFASIVSRLFGHKHVKDEHDERNYIAKGEFAKRFPELLAFLQHRLAQIADKINLDQQFFEPQLYPILVILSRLTSTSSDVHECSQSFASIILSLRQCLARFVIW